MNIKQQALLYLTYLLVYSDGEFDDDEKNAISFICKQEGISPDDYQGFLIQCQDHSERELFDKGVDLLEECDLEEKKRIFVWLYKLSESDGTVHAKEVRFLLYSLRRASIDLDDIKVAAELIPSIPPPE